MNRMAEQEIKDTLKKSEFRTLVQTVISTATILCGMFFGGIKIIDAVKASLIIEVKAEVRSEMFNYQKLQAIKDDKQDEAIREILERLDKK